MVRRSARLWILVLAAIAPRESCFGTSSHVLMYFYTTTSDFSQRLPHYVFLGYVNNQAFIYYDSNNREMQPRVSWMEKVKKEEPQNWENQIQKALLNEEAFKEDLEIMMATYNHSEVPGSNVGLIIGYLVVGLVLARVIAGTLIFFKMAAELDSGEGHRPVRESGDDCDDDPASDRDEARTIWKLCADSGASESDSSEAEEQGSLFPVRVCADLPEGKNS